MAAYTTSPVYPPGVFQTITIPDPTSLDGLSDLEITLIPTRGVTDINHISVEGIAAFKEMLYEIDEEYHKTCALKMNAILVHDERLDSLSNDHSNRDNCWDWVNQEGPYDCSDCGWVSYMDTPHFRDEYTAYVPWQIAEVLGKAEEDADYEEWLTSKQYQDSLKEYNKHKLLAWNKVSDGEHPKWSGEYKVLQQTGVSRSCEQSGNLICELYNSYIKERYRVEVDVAIVLSDNDYAKGSTPYGDVYIPRKIAAYLKNGEGLYEMDIALQDVEGAPGKKPNAFRWTCVYLRNKGHTLE